MDDKGWNKKIEPKSFVRSNIFTKDLAVKMKAMGFKQVRFGAESGSDRVLKVLGKGATVNDHQKAIDIGNTVGLKVSASFMYGLPSETSGDLKMTRDFIEKNKGKLKVEGWYRFKAFPGTSFFNGEDLTREDMRVR